MTAQTITFSVQLGTNGVSIARNVAQQLRYHFFDWEVTSRAAERAGVSPDTIADSERYKPLLKRLVDDLLGPATFVDDDSSFVGADPVIMASAIRSLSGSDYRGLVEDVVRELASQGDSVIVGHASQVVLQNQPGVLKVLVSGNPERRAERFAAATGQPLEAATRSILQSDRERQAFFRRVYKVETYSWQLYDLTINTDRVADETAVDIVTRVARSQLTAP